MLGRYFIRSAVTTSRIFAQAKLSAANFHKSATVQKWVPKYQFKRAESWYTRISVNQAVYGTIAVNTAVFIAWQVAKQREKRGEYALTNVMNKYFLCKHQRLASSSMSMSDVISLVGCVFSHKEPFHLLSNMIGFYYLGTSLGAALSVPAMAALYLTSGITSSLSSVVYHKFFDQRSSNQMTGSLGASGAVMGLLCTYGLMFRMTNIYIYGVLPVPAIVL